VRFGFYWRDGHALAGVSDVAEVRFMLKARREGDSKQATLPRVKPSKDGGTELRSCSGASAMPAEPPAKSDNVGVAAAFLL